MTLSWLVHAFNVAAYWLGATILVALVCGGAVLAGMIVRDLWKSRDR